MSLILVNFFFIGLELIDFLVYLFLKLDLELFRIFKFLGFFFLTNRPIPPLKSCFS